MRFNLENISIPTSISFNGGTLPGVKVSIIDSLNNGTPFIEVNCYKSIALDFTPRRNNGISVNVEQVHDYVTKHGTDFKKCLTEKLLTVFEV